MPSQSPRPQPVVFAFPPSPCMHWLINFRLQYWTGWVWRAGRTISAHAVTAAARNSRLALTSSQTASFAPQAAIWSPVPNLTSNTCKCMRWSYGICCSWQSWNYLVWMISTSTVNVCVLGSIHRGMLRCIISGLSRASNLLHLSIYGLT